MDLKTVSIIGSLTRTYQEIAQLKMMKIRQDVLITRNFLNELAKIYHLVKKSYIFFFKKKWTFVEKKNDTVIVFLSANEFFYGTLILDIWALVQEYLKKSKNKIDLVIIGKLGRYLVENSGFQEKIFYFELDDEKPGKEGIKTIIDFIKNYEKIIVFHGKFETVLNQVPTMTDISGGPFFEEEGKETKRYLFEPSPEQIFEFFETEISTNLFHQTILEHKLARYAARMMAMYQASENAKKMKRDLEKDKIKLEKETTDKKQVEIFSGFKLWSKKV